jgi:hypothetical protein
MQKEKGMNDKNAGRDERRSTRLAVLIDADNASPQTAPALFEEVAKLGEASLRRIYGDFSTGRLKGWQDILARHAIVPSQSFAYTAGKNASDIALVIDAMDLLHSGIYDGFCLVSSDSDFTRLAQRLREAGAEVYGFGKKTTPESFVQACRRFFYVENLGSPQPSPEAVAPIRPAAEAEPLLLRAIAGLGDEEGWVPVKKLDRAVHNISPDFDVRAFGEQYLSDLARRTGRFESEKIGARGYCVRIKPDKPARRRRARKPVEAQPKAGDA